MFKLLFPLEEIHQADCVWKRHRHSSQSVWSPKVQGDEREEKAKAWLHNFREETGRNT